MCEETLTFTCIASDDLKIIRQHKNAEKTVSAPFHS